MRKVAGALGVVSLVLSCQSPHAARDEARTSVARLSGVAGAVEILRGGGVDWQRIRTGIELFDDDRLRTYKGATATLAFPNGSSLRVDEESLISLGALSLGGGITVERGTVQGELLPGLKVRTPAAEAEATRDLVIQ
jgi:hypothetical protein